LVSVPVPVLDPDLFSLFKKKKKNPIRNLAFSKLEAALFPRKLASNFEFFDFVVPFYVESGSKSGSKTGNGTRTGMHYGSGSSYAKSYGSCGSGFTTLAFTLRLVEPSQNEPEQKLIRYIRYGIH